MEHRPLIYSPTGRPEHRYELITPREDGVRRILRELHRRGWLVADGDRFCCPHCGKAIERWRMRVGRDGTIEFLGCRECGRRTSRPETRPVPASAEPCPRCGARTRTVISKRYSRTVLAGLVKLPEGKKSLVWRGCRKCFLEFRRSVDKRVDG